MNILDRLSDRCCNRMPRAPRTRYTESAFGQLAAGLWDMADRWPGIPRGSVERLSTVSRKKAIWSNRRIVGGVCRRDIRAFQGVRC